MDLTEPSVLFGLYQSATRLGFGLWGICCVHDAVRQRHGKDSGSQGSFLTWTSSSAVALSNTMAASLVADLVLIR